MTNNFWLQLIYYISTHHTGYIFQKIYLKRLWERYFIQRWWDILLPILDESTGFSWFSLWSLQYSYLTYILHVVATTHRNGTCDMLTSAKLSVGYPVVGITRELDKEPLLHCSSIYINYMWSVLQQYLSGP